MENIEFKVSYVKQKGTVGLKKKKIQKIWTICKNPQSACQESYRLRIPYPSGKRNFEQTRKEVRGKKKIRVC